MIDTLIIIAQLIFLEGILSIDNAAVLGALVTPLPSDQNVPWPRRLARLGHLLDPLLGKQRMAGLRVGLLGAYLGRGLMLAAATFIITNPWLKLIGAAYLIRLALDDLGSSGGAGEGNDGTGRIFQKRSFWATVLTVELMDLAFSIDNVVAAVSLSDKLWVVIVGVAIGILAMRYAAGIFSYLVEREPVLQKAAFILILNIGVELILEDLVGWEISDWTRFAISLGTVLLALAYAHSPILKIFRPMLVWISQAFGFINALLNWLLSPLTWLLRQLWQGLKLMLGRTNRTAS